MIFISLLGHGAGHYDRDRNLGNWALILSFFKEFQNTLNSASTLEPRAGQCCMAAQLLLLSHILNFCSVCCLIMIPKLCF